MKAFKIELGNKYEGPYKEEFWSTFDKAEKAAVKYANIDTPIGEKFYGGIVPGFERVDKFNWIGIGERYANHYYMCIIDIEIKN
jgi:hypothetical protein